MFNNKNLPTRTYTRTLKPKEVISLSRHGEIPYEYENACRLCLENSDILIEIFAEKDSLIPTDVKIRSLLSIEVHEDDELPSSICEKCLNQLNEAYDFKKRCKANDVKLRQFVSKCTPKTHCPESIIDRINEDGSVLDDCENGYNKDVCTFKWDDQVPQAAVITSNKEVEGWKSSSMECSSASQLSQHESSVTQTLETTTAVDSDDHYEEGENSSVIQTLETTTAVDSDDHYEEGERSSEPTQDYTDNDISVDTRDKTNEEENGCTVLTPSLQAQSDETEIVLNEDVPLDRRLEMEVETKQSSSSQKKSGGEKLKAKQPQTQCPKCKIVFRDENMCSRHMNICFPKYTCDFCAKVFRSPSLVVRHLRVHTGERPYHCGYCKKSFNQKELLQRHIGQRHTTNRPYKCKVCPKAYALPLLLSAHIRTSHSEHNFKCKLCPKMFRHASGLSRHQHLHNGTIFVCKMCHKRFTDASSIKRHIRQHNVMDNDSDSES